MNLTFLQSNKSNWGDQQFQLSQTVVNYLGCGKDFEVEFREVKDTKSWRQIKGIHKLCQLLAVRFGEAYGSPFTTEDAKLNVKLHFDYLRPITTAEAINDALFVKEQLKAKGEKVDKKRWNEILEGIVSDSSNKKPKSFAKATKKEMMGLIEGVHKLAESMGWHEVKLTNAEMQELVNNFKEE